MGGGNIAREA